VFWYSGNDSDRYEPPLCEVGLNSRFSRESGTYDCDKHARISRMTGQMSTAAHRFDLIIIKVLPMRNAEFRDSTTILSSCPLLYLIMRYLISNHYDYGTTSRA
jgi:hypothetical protein